ncbi:MAG TPA: hypothetical protein VIJ92_04435 [Ginsengibacter sp.]
MSKFITTIQLQNGNENDYDILHKELEKELFKNEEHAAKSKAYINEKEAFSIEGNMSLHEVIDSVKKIISKTGKKASFFVIRDKYVSYPAY